MAKYKSLLFRELRLSQSSYIIWLFLLILFNVMLVIPFYLTKFDPDTARFLGAIAALIIAFVAGGDKIRL